jgi:hypothetical protein
MVTPEIKRNGILLVGSVVILAALAAVVLRVIPGRHRPLEYMIAGTAATAVALAAAFAVLQIHGSKPE